MTVLTFSNNRMRRMAVAHRPLRPIHRSPQLLFQLVKPPALIGCHACRIMIEPHLSQLDTIFQTSQIINMLRELLSLEELEEGLDSAVGGHDQRYGLERFIKSFPVRVFL